MLKLDLDVSDIDTISRYVRISQYGYHGPIVIDMKALANLYMLRAEAVALVGIRRAMQ